jgi:hypothetical protein
VAKLLDVGSVQEVEWIRMPAKRLAIGPSMHPTCHCPLTPPCPATTLVYVSHDYIYSIDLFEFALHSYTASLFSTLTAYHLRLSDQSAQQARNSSRHSPSSPYPNRANSPLPPSQQTNNSSDRQNPFAGFLSVLFHPVGTAHTPLNKP